MEQLLQRLRNQPLSQQLALAAAGCCLLATLTLVGVAAQSTQSIQNATLAEHADAAVRQLASRASAELAAGDRLRLVAELQFYTCLLYTSPSPRDKRQSRMPSSA